MIRRLSVMLLIFVSTFTFSRGQTAEIPIEDVPDAAKKIGIRNQTELTNYLEIKEIITTEDTKSLSQSELLATEWLIKNGTANEALPGPVNPASGIMEDLLLDLGDVKTWIRLGQKLWEVIRNNQPVINVKTQTISILPQAKPNWSDMETWKGPIAKSYTIAAKNLYGMTVISHTYTVAFHYGGSVAGHGQFLANATIIPSSVNITWGFTLNSQVNVGEPLNTGTRLDPIPGVDLSLEWSMSSMLKKSQGVDQFFVRGDGASTHVNLY